MQLSTIPTYPSLVGQKKQQQVSISVQGLHGNGRCGVHQKYTRMTMHHALMYQSMPPSHRRDLMFCRAAASGDEMMEQGNSAARTPPAVASESMGSIDGKAMIKVCA